VIRVLVAEDQGMVLGALAALLALEADIEIVGRAADGLEAWALVQRLRPDVLVSDIEMPGMTGLDLAEKICAAGSACRVLIVTTFARPPCARRSSASARSRRNSRRRPGRRRRRWESASARS
jgi:two-component system response regulator DesR